MNRLGAWVRWLPWTFVVCVATLGRGAGVLAAPGESSKLQDSELQEIFRYMEGERDVVWAASKTRESSAQAPGSITVLTRAQLERFGYRSVAEALRHMPGLYVVDDYLLPNLGVRGIAGGLFGESGNVKLMIDGNPVAFRSTGSNLLGPELMPVTAIERIELVRGPGSALYGADAFLGVVNVVTRVGVLRGTEASVAAATEGRGLDYKADVSLGTKQRGFELLLSVSADQDDFSGLSLRPDELSQPRIPGYHAGSLRADGLAGRSLALLAAGKVALTSRTRLSLLAQLSELSRGGDLSPWTQLSYGYDAAGRLNATRLALRRGLVALSSETELGLQTTLSTRLRYGAGAPTEEDRIEVFSDALFVRRAFGYDELGASAEVRFEPVPRLSAVGGLELDWDGEQRPSRLVVLKYAAGETEAGQVDEATSTRQRRVSLWNAAAFAQAQYSALDRLRLTGGVRLDANRLYGQQLSGRAAAVFQASEPTVVKVLWGSAFKAPSPFLLYALPLLPGDVVGNEELRAQYVHAVELVFGYRPSERLSLLGEVSHTWLLRKAEFIPQGSYRVARNLADTSALSALLELRVVPWSTAEATVSAEWNLVRRDLGQEGYLSDIFRQGNPIYPPWVVRAGGSAPLGFLPLELTCQVLVAGPRLGSDINVLLRAERYAQGAYGLLDLGLRAQTDRVLPGRDTVLRFVVKNVLDARAADPGFSGVDYPLRARTFLLSLELGL